jgi:hypothetical protein
MKKLLVVSLAGAVAAGSLLTAASGTASAAPGDTAAHLGEVLPGSVSQWGGISGWVGQNQAAIQAQGYDPAKVAKSGSASTNVRAGTIKAPREGSVGAAVGDATGTLSIALGDGGSVGAKLVPQAGVQLFSAAEVINLLPVLEMTVNPDPAFPTDPPVIYDVDVKAGTITKSADTPDPEFLELDPVIAENTTFIMNKIKSEISTSVLDGLNDGLTRALTDEVMFGTTIDYKLPFSFAYPFTDLTNGATGTVQLDNVLAGTWLGQFDPADGYTTTITPAPVTELTLSNFLPANTPGGAYSDQVSLTNAFWTPVSQELAELMDSNASTQGIWLRSAGDVRQGINNGFAGINDTAPLLEVNENFVNTVTFKNLTSTDQANIHTKLKTMTKTKVAAWKNLLQVTGPVTLYFEPGAITSLTATDVTGSNGGIFGNLIDMVRNLIDRILQMFLGIVSLGQT